MKNRKRGFSLVELLIVLAVIAALIATITPVALNAIRKSQATKVAQNLKTLASAFENYVYVNNGDPDFDQLGRDINKEKYNVAFTESNGGYTVTVMTSEEADIPTVLGIISDAQTSSVGTLPTGLNNEYTGTTTFYYQFYFESY